MHKVYSIKKKKYSKKYFLNFKDFTHDSIELGLDVIMKYNITKDQELSEQDIEIAISEQQLKDTKLAAYNYVSYKPRSEYEVRCKLETKEFSNENINLAIKFLYEFHLIDDKEYASIFVKNYIKRNPSGKFKIKNELLKRGITEDLIATTIRDNYPIEDTLDLALIAAKKHKKKISHKPIEKQKNLVTNFLVRRGFDWDIIKNTISKLF